MGVLVATNLNVRSRDCQAPVTKRSKERICRCPRGRYTPLAQPRIFPYCEEGIQISSKDDTHEVVAMCPRCKTGRFEMVGDDHLF